jgi:hypothetical protein
MKKSDPERSIKMQTPRFAHPAITRKILEDKKIHSQT